MRLFRNNGWVAGIILCAFPAIVCFRLYLDGALSSSPWAVRIFLAVLFAYGIWGILYSVFGPRVEAAAPPPPAELKSWRALTGKERAGLALLWLMSMGFAGVGIFAWYDGASGWLHGYNSRHWPQTEGWVTASGVSQVHGRSPSGRETTTYEAKVAYDYRVSGLSHSGSRVAFLGFSGDHARAQAIVDQYPNGHKVTVYYAPDDPKMSVLEPGVSDGGWWSAGLWMRLIIGVVFVSMGLLFFVISRSVRRV